MGQVVGRVHRVVRPGTGRDGRDGRGRRGTGADDDQHPQHTYSTCVSERRPYFGTHFLMGGEKYELAKPEAFLFGENSDLDILGDKPVLFPYAKQQITDPVRPLNLYVNIRKESVKFVKLPKSENSSQESDDLYRIEFIFDADYPCSIQIYFNAREYAADQEIQFVHREPGKVQASEKFMYGAGADQHFDRYIFNVSDFDVSKLHYTEGNYYPVLIAIRTQDEKQLQTTAATIECAADKKQQLLLKALRQKISFDGVVYLLQEIFGIENKEQHDVDENGFECIICMSEIRDTVILPCRHLCLCNGCAEALRYRANNCPICRSPFRALIQMRAFRMVNSVSISDASSTAHPRSQTRWEPLALVEALNGPLNHMQSCMISSNVTHSSGASSELYDEEVPPPVPTAPLPTPTLRSLQRARSGRIQVQKIGDAPEETYKASDLKEEKSENEEGGDKGEETSSTAEAKISSEPSSIDSQDALLKSDAPAV